MPPREPQPVEIPAATVTTARMTDTELLASISHASVEEVDPLASDGLLPLLWTEPKRMSWHLPDCQVGRVLAALELARRIARESAMRKPFGTNLDSWARAFYLSHARGDRDVYGALYLEGDHWIAERTFSAASLDERGPRPMEAIRPALDLGADRFVLFNIHHRGDAIPSSVETHRSLLVKRTAKLFDLCCLATYVIGSPNRSTLIYLDSDRHDKTASKGETQDV